MKVGSIVYATDQGLGILAKDFYDNGVFTEPFIVNHHKHQNHYEWYPNTKFDTHSHHFDVGALVEFVRSLDVLLCFETPFHWPIFDICRGLGVKTALMTMYECHPRNPQAHPDLFICPSDLDMQCFPRERSVRINVPVPRSIEWNFRTRAKTFVHNAGHLGLRGRNGTVELLQAIPHIQNQNIHIIIRMQENLPKQFESLVRQTEGDHRITFMFGSFPHKYLTTNYGMYAKMNGVGVFVDEDKYSQADVCLRPEKFNGLSMPLQEAYASGMVCVTTNRYPMNTWLPHRPMINVKQMFRSCVSGSYLEFDECVIDPKDIAESIDKISCMSPVEIAALSTAGQQWALNNSWDVLKPQYDKILHNLVRGN